MKHKFERKQAFSIYKDYFDTYVTHIYASFQYFLFNLYFEPMSDPMNTNIDYICFKLAKYIESEV